MTSELIVLLDGREAGRVRNDARGRITFVYDRDWRHARLLDRIFAGCAVHPAIGRGKQT
jgi:hypothetical protein